MTWRPHLRWSLAVVPLLLATGGLYAAPLLKGGVPIAGDHPFYLAVSYAVHDALWDQGWLTGWSPDDFAGYPLVSPFLPAPLGFLAISVASRVTSLAIPELYAALVVLSYVLPGVALWLLLAARLHPLAALAGASLYLLSTYHLVQPLQGMWAHYLGLGTLLLFMHYGDRWLKPSITLVQTLCLGLLIVVAGLTSASTWPVLLLLVPVTLVFYARADDGVPRRLAITLVGPCLALLLLATWTLFIQSTHAGWGIEAQATDVGLAGLLLRLPLWLLLPGGSRIIFEDIVPALRDGEILAAGTWAGRLLAEHLPELTIVLLSVAGLASLRSGARDLDPGLGTFLRYVLVALATYALLLFTPWPLLARAGVPTPFRPEWFVPYINSGLAIFAACAVHRLYGRIARARWAGPALAILALVGLHLVRYSTYGAHVPLKASGESVIHAELADVWGYLRRTADPREGRVMYQELEGVAFLDGGFSNLAALSARQTGIASVATWTLKTHLALRRPALLDHPTPLRSPEHVREFLERCNSPHIVLWHPGIKQRLLQSGDFRLVHESPNRLFSVFRLTGPLPQWLHFDRGVDALRAVSVEATGLTFTLRNSTRANSGFLKMSYHPGWQLAVNGHARRLLNRDGLLGFADLPTGELRMAFHFW